MCRFLKRTSAISAESNSNYGGEAEGERGRCTNDGVDANAELRGELRGELEVRDEIPRRGLGWVRYSS